jgi:hypothetical protein
MLNDGSFDRLSGSFQALKIRLNYVGSKLPPPDWPPDEDPEQYYETLRRRVVEEEKHTFLARWADYLQRYVDKHGTSNGAPAMAMYEAAKANMEAGQDPRWPPEHTERIETRTEARPPKTADRPMPEHLQNDWNRVVQEARNLGFGNVPGYPGHWEFAETLGMGGFGRKLSCRLCAYCD